MKAVIAVLCLVVLATAHLGHDHHGHDRHGMRPTGRPDGESWKEKVEQWKKQWKKLNNAFFSNHEERRKQWEEKKKQILEANRPTGRPQSWRERLEQMKKEHEERRKQWEARRPTGRPSLDRRPWRWGMKSKKSDEEDETALVDQLAKWRQMWSQRPTGRPMTWRERLAVLKKAEELKRVEERNKQLSGKKPMTWAEIKKTIEERRKAWAEKLQKLKAAKDAKKVDSLKGDKDQNDADETEILSPFKTHLDSFQTKFNDLLSQHQGSYKDLYKTLDKMFKQHHSDLEGVRPTGRPGNAAKDVYEDAHSALHAAQKDAWKKIEEARKQKKESAKQAQLAAALKNATPFLVHVDNFKKAIDSVLEQNPDATEDQLWKMLEAVYDKAHKDMDQARPTGRPSKEEKDGHSLAHKNLHEAKDDAEERFENFIKKMRDAQKQKQMAQIKQNAAPFLMHIDSFKKALDSLLEKNPDATENELWKLLEAAYKKAHKEFDEARPTGRPTKQEEDAHKFAHKALHEAKEDAEERIEKLVQKLKEEAKQKQMEAMKLKAGPFLTHVDNFKAAFQNLLSQKPSGSRKELDKKFEALFEKFHHELKDARPTGRPSHDEKKAYEIAHNMLHQHENESYEKMKAWRKQMDQLTKSN